VKIKHGNLIFYVNQKQSKHLRTEKKQSKYELQLIRGQEN